MVHNKRIGFPASGAVGWSWIVRAWVAGLALAGQAGAGVQVGFLDAMTRPGREEGVTLLPRGRIEAARGEWEPLQVVLRGGDAELDSLILSVEKPVNGRGETLGDGLCYRGDYVEVVRSTELAPLPPGWYVDPLVPIPEGRPLLAPGTVRGAGVRNQPVWVDFRVPETARPGMYEGQVVLRSPGGAELARGPFEVRVWDFELPRRPTIKSSIGMDPRRVAKIHGLEMGTRVFNLLCRQYEDALADHLLTPEGFWGTLEAFDGDHGTASLDREGLAGLGTPRDVFRHFFEEKRLPCGSIGFWREWPLPDGLGKDRETALGMLAQLMRQFDAAGWGGRILVNAGAVDEPGSREEYEEVREYGKFYNELEQRFGVRLPMYVTEQPQPESRWWGALHGYVDVYVTHVSDLWDDMHGRKTRAVEARRKLGDEIWFYPAMVQVPDRWMSLHGHPKSLTGGNPPAWILDFPPMNHRIFAWAAPLYGVTGILYWDTVEWRDGVDPWKRADTFELEGTVFNGDGLLLYPGFRRRQGFEGPVPCVRLKWIREGMEDHAYLTLLREKCQGEWAEEQIRRVCRGIGDWDADPAKLFQVRRDLAEKLESLAGGAAAPRD